MDCVTCAARLRKWKKRNPRQRPAVCSQPSNPDVQMQSDANLVSPCFHHPLDPLALKLLEIVEPAAGEGITRSGLGSWMPGSTGITFERSNGVGF